MSRPVLSAVDGCIGAARSQARGRLLPVAYPKSDGGTKEHTMAQQAGTALAVVAHPDDVEFNFGGAMALWIDAGWRVVYVICTRGDKGSDDPTMTSRRLATIRRAEQEDAARFLGAAGVEFLGYDDGGLEPTLDPRRDIARQIRRHRPARLVTTDPQTLYTERYIQHPDHLAAARAALAATYAARDRLTMPDLLAEGLEPHGVAEVYMYGSRDADLWVDIAPVLERKKEALRHHRSQVSEEFLGVMEAIARQAAEGAPPPRPDLAESFKVVRL
jgi:LmbE family N-acetylglucosaminyl deacetylase